MTTYSSPHETATTLGITPATLRRWSEYHSAFLSSGAQANGGQARRFTGKDLEILKYCAQLREQGQTVANINEQLTGLTFAEIDASQEDSALAIADALDTRQDTPANALQTAQDAQDTDTALGVALHAIATIQHDMAALKQSVSEGKHGQRDYIQGLAVGFVGALLFVILLLLLFLVRGYL